MDDILVHGPTKAIHDKRLDKCQGRLKELNLTTKKEKEHIGLQQVDFWGVELTGKDVQMDPKNIEAVVNCGRPEDTSSQNPLWDA